MHYEVGVIFCAEVFGFVIHVVSRAAIRTFAALSVDVRAAVRAFFCRGRIYKGVFYTRVKIEKLKNGFSAPNVVFFEADTVYDVFFQGFKTVFLNRFVA